MRRAGRPGALLLHPHRRKQGPAEDRRRPQCRAELGLQALKSRKGSGGQYLEHVDPVAPGTQRGFRDEEREVLAALPPEVEASAHGADPPVHRNGHVAVLAEGHAAQGPRYERREVLRARAYVAEEPRIREPGTKEALPHL